MIELRFNPDLYSGFAIDEATKIYADFAEFELEQELDAYIVRISSEEHDEQLLADEFSNFALGATIERRDAGPTDEASSEG